MKILALDTSSAACSVALLANDRVKLRHEVIPMQHAKSIIAFLEDIIGPNLNSLDAIAWGCGPGSFTGVRIGASVAQALGFARKLPILNISSLAALAQTAYEQHGWSHILAAVDARMGEVYWAAYVVGDDGCVRLINNENLTAPGKIFLDVISQDSWYGVGSAWGVYREQMAEQLKVNIKAVDTECLPNAKAIALLGKIKYQKGEWVQPFDALPVYLRDNVV